MVLKTSNNHIGPDKSTCTCRPTECLKISGTASWILVQHTISCLYRPNIIFWTVKLRLLPDKRAKCRPKRDNWATDVVERSSTNTARNKIGLSTECGPQTVWTLTR